MADSTDDQTGFQMSDDDGDLIYEVTIDLEKIHFTIISLELINRWELAR